MKWGSWFAKYSGGFGVYATFARDVKRLLSSQQVQSHVSVICMGYIPSLKSNSWKIGVKQFADFDPGKMMEKLGAYASATQSDHTSMDEAANSAMTGGQMISFRDSEIKSVMTSLGDISDGENKVLDINSLMTAFEDYVEKAANGKTGVPINYYIKPIGKRELARIWVDKYYPGVFSTAKFNPDEEESKSGETT